MCGGDRRTGQTEGDHYHAIANPAKGEPVGERGLPNQATGRGGRRHVVRTRRVHRKALVALGSLRTLRTMPDRGLAASVEATEAGKSTALAIKVRGPDFRQQAPR